MARRGLVVADRGDSAREAADGAGTGDRADRGCGRSGSQPRPRGRFPHVADPVKQHMLDRLLRIAADRAAAPSGIRFTERQLYYEVCRLLTPTHRVPRRFAFTVPAPLSYFTFR